MSTASAESSTLEEKFVSEVDEQIAKLEPRLAPLKEEYDRLMALRQKLTGSARGRPAPRPRATGSSTTRAAQGTRQEEFMQHVIANPGITIPELAQKMDIQTNYLYRIRTQTKAKGMITTEGPKIFPVDAG